MAFKAINDIVRLNSIILTLLVYGAYCGGAPRRLLNSVDFGGFQRFSTSATRDWNGGIIAGFL
jgi:hypothetical protein